MILNFGEQERDDCYKITASCMHHGNMKFRNRGREEQAEPEDDVSVSIVSADLLDFLDILYNFERLSTFF